MNRGITPDDVHAFESTIQSMGKPIDVKIYPDAGHAFKNPDDTAATRQKTQKMRRRGWQLFAKELKSPAEK